MLCVSEERVVSILWGTKLWLCLLVRRGPCCDCHDYHRGVLPLSVSSLIMLRGGSSGWRMSAPTSSFHLAAFLPDFFLSCLSIRGNNNNNKRILHQRLQRGHGPANTLILTVYPSELWKNTFLVSSQPFRSPLLHSSSEAPSHPLLLILDPSLCPLNY